MMLYLTNNYDTHTTSHSSNNYDTHMMSHLTTSYDKNAHEVILYES